MCSSYDHVHHFIPIQFVLCTIWKWPSVAGIHAFRGGLQMRLWQVKIGLRSFVVQFSQVAHRVALENLFVLWDGSNYVEASVLTAEVISWKPFRRLAKEKAPLAREIDKGKECWNFAWLKENVSVPVSWEGKTKEHSMLVGDCIDSDRDQFTVKGIL